jgi:pilus assembly protein Flp/PilA
MLAIKFNGKPTEETLDWSRPGETPGNRHQRRREEMLTKFFAKMQNEMQDEEGQGLVEYALIIVLISIVAIVALTLLGSGVSSVFRTIVTTL